MFRRIAFLLVCIACFGNLNKIYTQTKITSETNVLPKGYTGVDPIALTANLKNLLKKVPVTGKSNKLIQDELKGKLVYENLTTDDFFAFVPDVSEWKTSWDRKDINTIYRGELFRLIHTKEFPEPQIIQIRGCGIGTGGFGSASSREDLVNEYNADVSVESIWNQGMFHLKTVIPTDIKREDYKGASGKFCPQDEFFVPTSQTHYELAFTKAQPFRLLYVTNKVFSLDTYRYETITGAGIVAWKPNIKYASDAGEITPLFITKLVAPYFKSESLTKNDLIEGRHHFSSRNKIYIDLIGIWLYDRRTGEVISKSAHESKSLTSVSPKNLEYKTVEELKTEPLQIISKPKANYTDEARQNNIQGTVNLRITFLANGNIGSIVPVNGLPYGLTKKAMEAARQIKFLPAKKNGAPINLIKLMPYTFTIY